MAEPHADSKKYNNPKGKCWRLAPVAENFVYTSSEIQNRSFKLQLNYQNVEKQPRLISNTDSVFWYAPCIATAQDDHGYENHRQAIWTVERVIDEGTDEYDRNLKGNIKIFDTNKDI